MSIKSQIQSTGLSILDAVDGLTDWRTLLLALGGMLSIGVFAMAAAMLGGATRSLVVTGILMLLAGIWALAVFNGIGMQVMTIARGGERLTVAEAAAAGLIALPKVIGLVLLLFLAYLALIIVILLIFLLCKIPGIGPILFAPAFPVSVVLLGFATFSLFYIAFPLACPAIWEGRSITESLGILLGIARDRAVSTIVMFILLGLLTGVVGGVLALVLGSGMISSGSIAGAVLGSDILSGASGAALGALMSGQGLYGGAGHLLAASIGMGLVLAASVGAISLVYLRGICTIYLQGVSGLDASEESERIRQAVGNMQAKVKQAGDAASEKLARAQTAAAPTEMSARHASTAALCPSCKTPVSLEDRFCESCGYKLK